MSLLLELEPVFINKSGGPMDRYIVRFPDGTFLYKYDQEKGIFRTRQLILARLWKSFDRAGGVAELFHAEVKRVLVDADGRGNPRLALMTIARESL